jgi:hypothetical protein
LFGPSLGVMQSNIKLHAYGPGFAGIINRIRAKQLLTDHWRKHGQAWFLIRLSRTEPDFLVFSTIDREGKVTHSLFKKNTIGAKVAQLKRLYVRREKSSGVEFIFVCQAVLPVKLLDEAYQVRKNQKICLF